MLKKFSSLLLMTLCGTLLTSTTLVGQENDGKNRIPAGVRLESQEELLAHKEARVQMAQCGQAQQENKSQLSKKASINKSLAKSVHYTTHPGAYHNPIGISLFGDIELEDGSIWKVAPSDSYITLSWLQTDLLIVTPNHSLFTSYSFKITNQNTMQAVVCNLNLGPLYNGFYTRWISAIDYYHNTVYLNDGSVWSMSAFDSSIVNKWLLNDTVIIGVNDWLFSSSNPNILINVNMLNFAAGLATY